MKSPFPGVDPFIEAQGMWPDFHARFVNYCCERIADVLPDAYEARLDERTSVIDLGAEKGQVIEPDIGITRARDALPANENHGLLSSSVVTVELLLPDEVEVRETFVEIYKRPERELVTVVELLSPSNKVLPGFGQYEAKRQAIFGSDVNLVELDFLLTGRRLKMGEPLPSGDYYALVAAVDRRPKCTVVAWSIRQGLPRIAVPLRAPDSPINLDLQLVFEIAYEKGRYWRSIDYSRPLNLPISPEEAHWCTTTAASSAKG